MNKERWHEKACELMHEVGRLRTFCMKVAQKKSFGVNGEVVVTILEKLGKN